MSISGCCSSTVSGGGRRTVAAPAGRGAAVAGADAGRPADLGRRSRADRERVALLLAHGVDPNVAGQRTPDARGPDGVRVGGLHTAARSIAALLAAAGARPPRSAIDAVDRFLAAALGEDAEAVRQADPAVRAAAIRRRPGAVEQAVDLRRPGAVRLLVEAGFSVHGAGGATPLHLAAYEGDLEMVRLLVSLGADPRREDPDFRSTPRRLGRACRRRGGGRLPATRVSSARPRPAAPPGPADPG